jgi:hypothetical protein
VARALARRVSLLSGALLHRGGGIGIGVFLSGTPHLWNRICSIRELSAPAGDRVEARQRGQISAGKGCGGGVSQERKVFPSGPRCTAAGEIVSRDLLSGVPFFSDLICSRRGRPRGGQQG